MRNIKTFESFDSPKKLYDFPSDIDELKEIIRQANINLERQINYGNMSNKLTSLPTKEVNFDERKWK